MWHAAKLVRKHHGEVVNLVMRSFGVRKTFKNVLVSGLMVRGSGGLEILGLEVWGFRSCDALLRDPNHKCP